MDCYRSNTWLQAVIKREVCQYLVNNVVLMSLQNTEEAVKLADEIGFPVMIKVNISLVNNSLLNILCLVLMQLDRKKFF